MSRVAIIILNWNGLADTLECLASLESLDYPDFEVLVVDNGSSDGSAVVIREKFPAVTVLENSENLGYTGGNNVGICHAIAHGADLVWLLNNDTVVECDTLRKLVDAVERSPGSGLVSPVVYFHDSPHVVQFRGAFADLAEYDVYLADDPAASGSGREELLPVLWGTALLVRREVFERVGLLAERYFAYHEDCDFSLRALRAGFQNLVCAEARIYHKDSRSTGGVRSPVQVYLRMRNAYFLWMDNSRGMRKVLFPCHFLGKVIHQVKVLSDEGNAATTDACLNGAWAGFRGRGGSFSRGAIMPKPLKRVIGFMAGWHPYFWIELFRGNIGGLLSETFARLGGRQNEVRK